MITNIIKIPQRDVTNIDNNNYWMIYEESYNNKDYLHDYTNNIKSCKDIFSDIENIYDIRYNFYNYSHTKVLSHLIINYFNKFLEINTIILKEKVSDFFKNGTLDNFLNIYLKSCVDTDISLLNKFTDEINHILCENTNSNVEVTLIKFQYYLNKLLKIISKFDKDGFLKHHIINNISKNYNTLLMKNIDLKGLTFISNILNQSVYELLFKKDKIIKHFRIDAANELKNKIVSLILNISEDDMTDSSFANNIFDSIKILNVHRELFNNEIIINNNTFLNKFTNYICASIFYILNENNIDKVYDIINLHYNQLPNKLDFLVYYKYHLQWRATHKLNYKFENIAFQHILKIFVDNEFKKTIDNIKNSLDDIFLSEHMNNEINNLSITIQTPKFKDIEFDTKKIDVFITSNIIWQDIKCKNNYSKIYKSEAIELYCTLVENYYNKKYTSSEQKRLLNISYDESFVDINLGNSEIRLPITYFSVLDIVGKSKEITLEEITRKMNIDEDKLINIINFLKINNIIIDNNNKFYFNNKILTRNVNINMMQNENRFITVIEEDISYDKDILIDSVICRVCKKQYSNSEDSKTISKYVSYGRLVMIIRGELNKYFIPTEVAIKDRLKRLVTLGYLVKDEEYNKFSYIP
jgi:hypothetical protein